MKEKKIKEISPADKTKIAPIHGYKNWQSREKYEELYFHNQKILNGEIDDTSRN
jgi:hypothetical protein